MVAKVEIVERLGDATVLLPGLVETGLEANDRLKIRLTPLQEASAQASTPGRPVPSMARELRKAMSLPSLSACCIWNNVCPTSPRST